MTGTGRLRTRLRLRSFLVLVAAAGVASGALVRASHQQAALRRQAELRARAALADETALLHRAEADHCRRSAALIRKLRREVENVLRQEGGKLDVGDADALDALAHAADELAAWHEAMSRVEAAVAAEPARFDRPPPRPARPVEQDMAALMAASLDVLRTARDPDAGESAGLDPSAG